MVKYHSALRPRRKEEMSWQIERGFSSALSPKSHSRHFQKSQPSLPKVTAVTSKSHSCRSQKSQLSLEKSQLRVRKGIAGLQRLFLAAGEFHGGRGVGGYGEASGALAVGAVFPRRLDRALSTNLARMNASARSAISPYSFATGRGVFLPSGATRWSTARPVMEVEAAAAQCEAR